MAFKSGPNPAFLKVRSRSGFSFFLNSTNKYLAKKTRCYCIKSDPNTVFFRIRILFLSDLNLDFLEARIRLRFFLSRVRSGQSLSGSETLAQMLPGLRN